MRLVETLRRHLLTGKTFFHPIAVNIRLTWIPFAVLRYGMMIVGSGMTRLLLQSTFLTIRRTTRDARNWNSSLIPGRDIVPPMILPDSAMGRRRQCKMITNNKFKYANVGLLVLQYKASFPGTTPARTKTLLLDTDTFKRIFISIRSTGIFMDHLFRTVQDRTSRSKSGKSMSCG